MYKLTGVSVGINESQNQQINFSIYPNPAQDIIHATIQVTKGGPANIEIMDASGRIVQRVQTSLQAGTNNINIPIHDLASGVYLIKVSNDKGMRYSQTIRKNN